MGSTLDLLPTLSKMAGAKLSNDKVYDGYDLSSVLNDQKASPRNEMLYYHGTRIFAARKGDFKLYFYKNNPMGYPEKMEKLDTYQLFNLQHDPSEQYNILDKHPQVVKEIEEMVAKHVSTVERAESKLEKRIVNK